MRLRKYSDAQMRAAMQQVADGGAAFFDTPEGLKLLEQIRTYSAPLIVSLAWKNDFRLEREVVVHTALVGLCERGGKTAQAIAKSDTPWGYFYKCLKGWSRQEWGHRAWESYEEAYMVAAPLLPECELTPIRKVVDMAFELLAPITEESLHAELHHLLGWLAINSAQRASYEFANLGAAQAEAPSFTAKQVQAVMNIAWGGRKDEPTQKRDSSLMYALLLDVDGFRPSDFPALLRALVNYKHNMRTHSRAAQTLVKAVA